MKKKRMIIFLIVILAVILGVGISIYVYFEHRNSIMEDIQFEEIATIKIKNPDKIDNNKYIYQITNQEELKKWGINIGKIEEQESDFLCYSLDYEIERIYHSKYNPDREWDNGPYIYNVDYKKSDSGVLHVYLVKKAWVWEFCQYKKTVQ